MSERRVRVCGLVTLSALLTACAGSPQRAPTPPIDHVVPVWQQGMPVLMRSFEISAQGYLREADIPADLPYQQSLAYIVGVVDTAIGASPHQRLATPEGGVITMPAHQTVLSCLGAPEAPSLGIAYSVIPGPAANALNLRADAAPDRSLIGAPLATHIRIGPSWLPLTSHAVIDVGLRLDVLRLKFFGANPVSWATPDWSDNYPRLPDAAAPCSGPTRAPRAYVIEATP